MRITTIASYAALALLPVAARAQVCGVTSGPDLVVGSMSSPTNYAPVAGIDACSLGVTLCNFGTQTVTVSASTSNHPIVMQNLYRYEVVNGALRFEQIGMSWAWNSSFLLEGNVCCTCTAVGGGNLGPGCSSPSTGNALGTQGALGPRTEIDAFIGAFPYPPSNPPYSGTVARRLQFAISDVDPAVHPGAQFFVEEIAISPGDASAGNAQNNTSYAPVTITSSGSDATVSLAGPVVRAQAAINAWQALDPSVVIDIRQFPFEGQFAIASRATDLGTGWWRYEYAIENLNSDLSCGAVRMDHGPYSVLANVGFHDVDYHDGDGPGGVTISGADWTSTVAGGVIQWTTDGYASNPSANALRAATLYGFRCDATAPPALDQITLSSWKSASQLTALALAVGEPPANGTPFCFGDGSGAACPCGNQGIPGHGCANSALSLGGRLRAGGSASLAQDTLSLLGDFMNNSSCLYFQGTTMQSGGAGVAFGDGLRCAGGTIVRLGVKTNAIGKSAYGFVAQDTPISQRGQVTQPGVRTYQAWYRDAQNFCTSDTFNLTNGVSITWTP